jgi:hypothetical protein
MSAWAYGVGADGRRLGPPQECKTCGATFTAALRYVRRGTANYCSVSCRTKDARRSDNVPLVRNGVRVLGRTVEVNCEHCGAAFRALERYHVKRAVRFCSRSCDNAWRSAQPRVRTKPEPVKVRARRLLRTAVATGRIIKPAICEWCGDDARYIDGHHADYSQPLEVEWVCRACHRAHHEQLKVSA